jgi:hypothetical protein
LQFKQAIMRKMTESRGMRRPWVALLMMLILTMGTISLSAASIEKAEDGYPIWNADNIPMVFLTDSTQFVCDPDNILTQEFRVREARWNPEEIGGYALTLFVPYRNDAEAVTIPLP